jgi:hypothetical protein
MQKIVAVSLMVVLLFLSLGTIEAQPTIGVKPGQWVEYHVVAGGNPPAAQDITWAKMEILDIEGDQFNANFSVQYVNGTISSSTRTFNFSAGNVQAWIIIPANLRPGQSFYDSSIDLNVTIQGQMTKTVAGASREITFTNSTTDGVMRHKEWDKATGFYIQSVDNVGNYTINANAYATNIWSPQILGVDQTIFYTVIAAIIVVVVVLVLFIARNRRKV